MEVTSQEEIHILALFDNVDEALRLQEIVYATCRERTMKMHSACRSWSMPKEKFSASTTDCSSAPAHFPSMRLYGAIHDLNGLAIASHIDRPCFSLIGQLGFIPDNLALDALEISSRTTYTEALQKFNPRFLSPVHPMPIIPEISGEA